MPALVAAFGATPNPDSAFMRFDEFLGRLPAGVPFFSLFYNNPGILSLVAEIMGAGTRLAETVAQAAGAARRGAHREFLRSAATAPRAGRRIRAQCSTAPRTTKSCSISRGAGSAIANSRSACSSCATGSTAKPPVLPYADIAETALAGLLPRVTAEFAKSHGALKGGAMVVVALGKLGSREMTPTSDLDLILIYDSAEDAEQSDGQRSLPAPAYYARLTQRYINALTAPTSEGALYEVDMRLRPSGTSGPLADLARRFPPLPRRSCLDLGADGADPRPRRRRAPSRSAIA